MGMFAVKNDKGEWLYSDEYTDWVDQLSLASFYDTFEDADDDIECWELSNAYVVKLAESPAKIVVSADEAEMLERAKDDYCAASVISAYSKEHIGSTGQDRLMRAYVIGWTVAKPKRYVLPMDGTKLADGTIAYATLDHTGAWTIKGYSEKKSAVAFHNTVTQADIDTAPDWVKAIKPVEVTDDEQ